MLKRQKNMNCGGGLNCNRVGRRRGGRFGRHDFARFLFFLDLPLLTCLFLLARGPEPLLKKGEGRIRRWLSVVHCGRVKTFEVFCAQGEKREGLADGREMVRGSFFASSFI